MKKNNILTFFVLSLSLMLTLIFVSCSKDNQKDTTTKVIDTSNDTNTKEEDSNNTDKTKEPQDTKINQTNSNSNIFLGDWVINKKIATTPIYALSDDEIKSYIGKKLSITTSKVSFEKNSYIDPNFKEHTLSDNEFILENKLSLKDLGINAESIKKIDVATKDGSLWNSFGNSFILKDSNTIIILWDGIFFELNKS